MKLLKHGLLAATLLVGGAAFAAPNISGDYLELRTCDIMVGECFANGQMNLQGKEAVMVWSVNEGTRDGVSLDGLRVMALVRTGATLGDMKYQAPKSPESLIVTDQAGTAEQQAALVALAKDLGGKLLANTVATKSAPMEVAFTEGHCASSATVKAGDLVQVATRPFDHGSDSVCGHEKPVYPPLTTILEATPAVAETASITDDTLNCTWKSVDSPNVFLGKFEA